MIYILAPEGFASGGPELLHQLGYKLRLLGFDARIYYYEFGNSREKGIKRHPNYDKYDVPYVPDMIDSPENIVIATEGIFQIFDSFKLCKKVVWWLSVDFAFMNEEKMAFLRTENDIIHLCQSQYATNYVSSEVGVPKERVFYLSDYINSIFLNLDSDFQRDDVVVFNPQKGFENTAQLIRDSTARIKWQALWGLKPDEMMRTMQKAKVYIDFGYHPGKDRMPREAVLAGCRIITNRDGAAKNEKDIPLSDELKFDNVEDTKTILDKIEYLLDEYEESSKYYDGYKGLIEAEFRKFEVDAYRFFAYITGYELLHVSGDNLLDEMTMFYENGNIREAFQRMIEYRLNEYEENNRYLILEASIRLAIGELEETIYCARRMLECCENNYEMWMILAQAYASRGKIGDNELTKQCAQKAVEYSQGTLDEETVREMCKIFIEFV